MPRNARHTSTFAVRLLKRGDSTVQKGDLSEKTTADHANTLYDSIK
jgi:hypothetical protein